MIQQALINVDYQDNTGKFWQDSYIKNEIIAVGDNIHQTIAKMLDNIDGVDMSYKGKPQSNVYIDDKHGRSKAVGYIYRVKTEIDGKKALFDAWITLKEVKDYPVEELDI